MATEDPKVSVRLKAIGDSGYLFERAVVRPGLILYRARPTASAPAGSRLLKAEGATDDEAVSKLYAAWAAGGARS